MRRFSTAFLRLLVFFGPVLLGLLTGLYIARPSPFFLVPGALLAIAVIACDGWIIARRHWITGSLALTAQIALLLFVGTYTSSPLPAPPPLSDALPPASPPPGMEIYALPTGVNHRTAAFARRGGPPWEKWDSVMTAALVRHPQGDVMIETGLGRTIASQFKQMPFLFRLATDLVPSQPAADQLDATGYDRKHLRYILVTMDVITQGMLLIECRVVVYLHLRWRTQSTPDRQHLEILLGQQRTTIRLTT